MRRQTPAVLLREFTRYTPENPSQSAVCAIWHKRCKTLFRPTVNAVEWAAPSVNDDRLTEQVAGNIGGSGIDA